MLRRCRARMIGHPVGRRNAASPDLVLLLVSRHRSGGLPAAASGLRVGRQRPASNQTDSSLAKTAKIALARSALGEPVPETPGHLLPQCLDLRNPAGR